MFSVIGVLLFIHIFKNLLTYNKKRVLKECLPFLIPNFNYVDPMMKVIQGIKKKKNTFQSKFIKKKQKKPAPKLTIARFGYKQYFEKLERFFS